LAIRATRGSCASLIGSPSFHWTTLRESYRTLRSSSELLSLARIHRYTANHNWHGIVFGLFSFSWSFGFHLFVFVGPQDKILECLPLHQFCSPRIVLAHTHLCHASFGGYTNPFLLLIMRHTGLHAQALSVDCIISKTGICTFNHPKLIRASQYNQTDTPITHSYSRILITFYPLLLRNISSVSLSPLLLYPTSKRRPSCASSIISCIHLWFVNGGKSGSTSCVYLILLVEYLVGFSRCIHLIASSLVHYFSTDGVCVVCVWVLAIYYRNPSIASWKSSHRL